MGMLILTVHMVLYIGGYKASIFNDLGLARRSFTLRLLPGEKTIADKGYSDEFLFVTTYTPFCNREMLKIIMARHAVVNQ